MWPLSKKKKLDQEQENKIANSQNALLDAAITTVEMAQFVTSKLKSRLEEAIQQFDATAALMSDALLICDSDGNIKACNPAAQSMFQYDFNEMTTLTILDLFNSHTTKMYCVNDLWDVLQKDVNKEDLTIGLKGVRKNKEIFSVEATITRLERSDSTAVFLILARNANTHNEKDTKAYRLLFDLTFDSILVVQNDKIVAANSQAGRMFGCKSEQLLSKPFTKLVNMKCDRQLTEGCINCHCKDDENVHEANAKREDGTLMTLLFSGTEIMWQGSKACLITARDTLKQFDRRFDNGIDMICFCDKHFNITFANEAFCNFYNIRSTGMDIRSLMSDTEKNAFMLNISNLTADHPTRRIQLYVDLEHIQDWIDHAVFDTNNDVIEIQHSVRDITEFVKEVIRS